MQTSRLSSIRSSRARGPPAKISLRLELCSKNYPRSAIYSGTSTVFRLRFDIRCTNRGPICTNNSSSTEYRCQKA
eukprot:290358-Pyramimonas_sp.AAC.1